jgi:DNA-binding GntR family transcriptional regulator
MTKHHHHVASQVTNTPTAPTTIDLAALWRQHQSEPVAADAIYSALREAILSGVLRAGERLAELQLAALFDRSRTPVREAILRLESDRLAERSPRRGFVVTSISREEILEVYAVREVLDGLAARLAAMACLPKDLDQLSWINQQLRKAGAEHNYRLMAEINVEFHETIARAGRNALLLQFMNQIHDWVRRFNETTFAYPGRIKESNKEHEELLDALARRLPDVAERVAREHTARAAEIRIAMQQSNQERSSKRRMEVG